MAIAAKNDARLNRWEKMEQVSPRIKSIREKIMNTVPEIFADRAVLITESYEETQGQPVIIRRAKALEKVLLNMKICILDGELVVGSYAGKPRSCQIYPEYDIGFIIDELDSFETRIADRFVISEDNKKLLKDIYQKWKGNTIYDVALSTFPENACECAKDLIFILTAWKSGVGHMIIDYGMALQKGLLSIIDEAEKAKNQLSVDDQDYVTKNNYYKAVQIVCKAAIEFANRFAELAENLAKEENNALRKEELLKIASNCRRVPAYPAETFWEAIQFFWFLQLILHIESNGHSVSPGRFDQYMYPYFKNDIETGQLSKEFAEELLHCLWLKFFELNKVRDKVSSVAFGGYPMFQNLIVGGQTSQGECAVNELSHMCLEATAKVGMPQPSLSIRWYFGCPGDFMTHAMEVVSYGIGLPALFNDEVLIPNMLQLGYSLDEARDYAIVGCTETTVPGITEPWLTGGLINLAKILELTIYNGYDPVLNKEYACKTGNVEKFNTFDNFKEAFFKQIEYYLKQHVICDNILDELHAVLAPTPFESIFIHDCFKRGKTSLEGGARYNFTTLEVVGIANVIDSLAVIKKIIYEDKIITWEELKKALINDFKGYENLRQFIINKVPKYGNDDDYVDLLGREVLNKLYVESNKYRNPRGGRYNIALYTIATHVLFAPRTGALPDGRKKGMVLADGGVSCSHGMDKNGLTALLKSVTKLDPYKATGSTLLNVKLNPVLFEGDNFQKVIDTITTYFLLKGQHVQFNVIDAKTLREAQKHPEKYPALTVRVAGFSVLFNTIDPLLQEDIIQRTEHQSFY